MRKVCVVTGSRADYGLLCPVLRLLDEAADFELQLVATGTHLDERFGATVDAILEDGFEVSARLELLQSGDDALSISTAMGNGVTGFGVLIPQLKPDLLLVLGDRFEILSVVQAALIHRIPVAHIAGGDVTEGAWDESIRHAITKLSHLHFVTHREARERVRQLGEAPGRVFQVGSPGIDALMQRELLSGDDLAASLGIELRSRNLLVTYHPETLDSVDPVDRIEELLAALDGLSGDPPGLWFTMPNADLGGLSVLTRIEKFTAERPHAKLWRSMGSLRYLSAMAVADAVIGNSSSGLYEAPSLETPTLNIGGRQDGRPRASSVVDCGPQRASILAGIEEVMAMDAKGAVNPFGDGQSSVRILEILRKEKDWPGLLRKRFWGTEESE